MACLIPYDNVPALRGKTFTAGEYPYYISYVFEKGGGVRFESSSTTIDHLKYILNGDVLKIYFDNSTEWNKESRNTVFAEGNYYGDYLMLKAKDSDTVVRYDLE